uniref:Uncharacterized protein n=1 Tax=Mycena chlorophos TaxID=658473 RepID=A0ABQ0M0N6_MYCCL|nr:predicted protein [Mycena chlorophos]
MNGGVRGPSLECELYPALLGGDGEVSWLWKSGWVLIVGAPYCDGPLPPRHRRPSAARRFAACERVCSPHLANSQAPNTRPFLAPAPDGRREERLDSATMDSRTCHAPLVCCLKYSNLVSNAWKISWSVKRCRGLL